MRKLIMLIAFLLALSITPKAQAFEKYTDTSAKLTIQNSIDGLKDSDNRVVALNNVFKKYGSPLTDYAYYYVKYADEYNTDWKLLPSISGLESSFGKHFVSGTYNAYGWGGGYIYFSSWEEGIDEINKSLRSNYYNRGADTVNKIGPIYAEASHWSYSVNKFMDEINQEYIKLASNELQPDI